MIRDACLDDLIEGDFGKLLWHAQRLAMAASQPAPHAAAGSRLVIDYAVFEFGGHRVTVAGDALLACCPPHHSERNLTRGRRI